MRIILEHFEEDEARRYSGRATGITDIFSSHFPRTLHQYSRDSRSIIPCVDRQTPDYDLEYKLRKVICRMDLPDAPRITTAIYRDVRMVEAYPARATQARAQQAQPRQHGADFSALTSYATSDTGAYTE